MKHLLLIAIAIMTTLTLSSITHADDDNRARMPRANSGAMLTGATLECARTAVTTREAAVRTAYAALSTAYLAGMDARAQSLTAAWTLTDKTARKIAREAAWTTWNTTAKTAREAFRTARKSAWDAFRTSTKACKVPSSEMDSNINQASDVQ